MESASRLAIVYFVVSVNTSCIESSSKEEAAATTRQQQQHSLGTYVPSHVHKFLHSMNKHLFRLVPKWEVGNFQGHSQFVWCAALIGCWVGSWEMAILFYQRLYLAAFYLFWANKTQRMPR